VTPIRLLPKDAEPVAIIRAILAVKEGQAIFDPGIAARVIAATRTSDAERPFPVLTEREYEISDRLARGLPNNAISARIGISIKTVQNNVSTILLKLGAADRAQAVALARDAGMGRRSLIRPPARRAATCGSRDISRCSGKATPRRPGMVRVIVSSPYPDVRSDHDRD
jgi:DNA-binding CsgD family transcriptional regulator